MTKADLEKFLKEKYDETSFVGGIAPTHAAFNCGVRAALELLWPCVERLQSCERYLDLLGYIPADSRQRELSEELWETAMFERDSATLALADLEGKLK